jgi:hypothetical protein
MEVMVEIKARLAALNKRGRDLCDALMSYDRRYNYQCVNRILNGYMAPPPNWDSLVCRAFEAWGNQYK